MSSIGSVGSGAAVDQLLEQFEAIERKPVDDLEFKRSQINQKKDIYSKLKTYIKEFKTLAQEYKRTGALSVFNDKAISSSDDKIISATADATAIDTTHSLTVSQLAKADTIVSTQYTQTGTEVSAAEGAGTKTFDITVDGETYNISLDLDGTEDNQALMEKVSNAINDTADIKVYASIVNDTPTTNKLVFTSKESGLANALTLTDTAGTLLSNLGISDSVAATGTTGGYLYADNLLNSKFNLDGIDIEAESNSVSNVLTGVTLDLKSTSTDPVTVTIKTDTQGLKTKVNSFLDKYNQVLDYINANSFVDKETFLRGPLSNDSTYRTLRVKLREMVLTSIPGASGDQPSTLSEIGITADRDGKLSISDSKQFEDQAKISPSYITDLFNSSGSLAEQFDDFLLEYTKTGGIVDRSKESLDNQVQNINTRIKQYEARIEIRIEAFRKQFAALQEALSAINSQQTALNSVLGAGSGFF